MKFLNRKGNWSLPEKFQARGLESYEDSSILWFQRHDRYKGTWKWRERTVTNRNLKLKTTCVVWSTSSWRSGPGQGSEAGRWAKGRTYWKKKRAGLVSVVPTLCTGFPGGAVVKNPPAMQDSPEKGMAIHTSILAWKVPWTEEPSGLQSMGSQRVGHDWATKHTHTHTHTHTYISPKLGIGLPWWIQGAKSCSGDARASAALNSPLLLLEATRTSGRSKSGLFPVLVFSLTLSVLITHCNSLTWWQSPWPRSSGSQVLRARLKRWLHLPST